MKISIIIPTYNADLYIEETLQSIENQTSKEWKCILVDDYSNDNTILKIEKFIKNKDNFKLIQKKNEKKGANSSRNLGIFNSDGNALVFIDADDYLDKGFIETRLNVLAKNSNFDVVFCPNYYRFKTIVSDSKEISKFVPYQNSFQIIKDYLEFKEPLPFIISSGIWKKNSLIKMNGFNEDYTRLQDVEMILRFLINSSNFKIINNSPDYYYRSEINESRVKEKRILYIENAIKLYRDLLMSEDGINLNDKNEFRRLLKNFANKTLKTLFISNQFHFQYFKDCLTQFKNIDKKQNFKWWNFFSFLKKYKISDKILINNLLYRIIK